MRSYDSMKNLAAIGDDKELAKNITSLSFTSFYVPKAIQRTTWYSEARNMVSSATRDYMV